MQKRGPCPHGGAGGQAAIGLLQGGFIAAIKRRRAALTVRQLVEDYLTHQLTRPVTQVSTRHHLAPLLAR